MSAALATLLAPSAAAQATHLGAAECGFYHVTPNVGDLTAKYKHCGNTFILIKVHWNNGGSYGICIPPWHEIPFYKDGTHRVTDAYYIPTAPNVATVGGQQICSLTQPKV